MPSAPAVAASLAARTGSGRRPPRAVRIVATGSRFKPRGRRVMTLSVIASALAADRFRKWNPFAVHASDRLLAMAATDADHHDEGRHVADAAHHQGLPADAVDEEELAGAGAEG